MVRYFLLLCFFTLSFSLYSQSDSVDVRCNTVNYNNKLHQQFPNIGTTEEFEKWMATEVHKLNARKGDRVVTTYTIPIIFHIIHNGQTIGATQNVSATYINAQIDQLNIDYANLAGSTNPVASNTEIQFCAAVVDPGNNVLTEPGIHRVNRSTYGFTSPPWADTYVDNTIKPASQWDPTKYFNVWVLDVSGGILGWAQFPEAATLQGIGTGNGAANTDGVVILYSSVGSMAVPFGGGNGAYDNGRTLTHEAGHWLGLRHIWGDGGCGVDDYCSDTPLSDAANFGCPTTNSCNDGSPDPNDMVQNYMDYTDDNCMDIFTSNQKDRMHVVMGATGNPSPRRAELNESPVCSSEPCFSFASTSVNVQETSDCTTSIVSVGVKLNTSLATSATVTLSLQPASTAALNTDFTVSSYTLLFPAGFSGTKYTDISIIGDGVVESNETIVLSISSITGTTYGTCNSSNMTITINDDDIDGENAVSSYTFLEENFNTSPATWTVIDGGSNTQTWEKSTKFNGSSSLNGTNLAMCNSQAAGSGSSTYETLISPPMNTEIATTLNLEFDQYFRRKTGGYSEKGTVDVWNGTSWINIYTVTTTTGGWSNPNHQNINILPYKNAAMQLRFIYDAQNDYYWSIDNVKVSGNKPVVPQTSVNSTLGFDEQYLGPMQTVYYNDKQSGNVMMKITNHTAHDYGCTRVEVFSSGNSYYTGGMNGQDIADKSYKITPTSNDPNGNVEVVVYYTEDEMQPWITRSNMGCEVMDHLQIIHNSSPIPTANSNYGFSTTTVQSFNTVNYKFSGSIFGLLGGVGLSDQIKSNHLFVKSTATGNGYGGSFENAFTDFDRAITEVKSCNNLDELWIAQGTYLPVHDQNGMTPPSSSQTTIYLNSNLSIFGSFEGVSGAPDLLDLSLRDFVNHATIFSGDHNGDDGSNQFNDNSTHVLTIGAAATDATVDGVIIEHGYGVNGCGIYSQGNLMLNNAIVRNCIASNKGAGIYLSGNHTLQLSNVLLKGNSPDDLYNEAAGQIIMDNTVEIKQ